MHRPRAVMIMFLLLAVPTLLQGQVGPGQIGPGKIGPDVGPEQVGPENGGGNSGGSSGCMMDIQCGTGKKCVDGVCTGGINPPIKGECRVGTFGKKVCSNSGKACNVDVDCLGN